MIAGSSCEGIASWRKLVGVLRDAAWFTEQNPLKGGSHPLDLCPGWGLKCCSHDPLEVDVTLLVTNHGVVKALWGAKS